MLEKWISLIEAKLNRWGVDIIKMLPNLLLAILVMILFVIVARVVRKFSEKFLFRFSHKASLSRLTSAVLYFLVVAIGFMTALNILNLEKAVTSLLAGVGIIGLALGFAFQDLTANFISGVFIAFRRPFDVNHTIETNGFIGRVEDIQLRATSMRTFAGLHVSIPNKDIFQKALINYSLTKKRRVEIEFAVPNTLGPQELERIIGAALSSKIQDHDVEKPEVYFSAIDEVKLKVYASFWTNEIDPNSFIKIKHEAIVAITRMLMENKAYG
jgi:small conductance mechanosensitive channel